MKRSSMILTVVAALGCTALVGCKSNDATYRPSPRYNSGTTTRPTPPSTGTPPPAAPGGQMACGAGKCG